MVVVYTGVSLIGRKGSMTVVAQNQFPYGDFLKLMDTGSGGVQHVCTT